MACSKSADKTVNFAFWKTAALLAAVACSPACGAEPSPGTTVPSEPDAGVAKSDTGVPTDASSESDANVVADARTADVQSSVVQMTAHVSGLLGKGLRLRTAAGEELTVEADGSVLFSGAAAAQGNELLTVVAQPTAPKQTCTARLADGAVEVACVTDGFAVAGQVVGFAGSGLVLHGSWGEDLTVSASGSFAFTQARPDLSSYAVTVGSLPASPKQSCLVEHGEGKIASAPVDDVRVVCTTERFGLAGSVSGMLGSGLVLELVGHESVAVASNGRFTFSASLADGSGYSVRIKQQPKGPDQQCVVLNGEAALSGATAELSVVCGALGMLRISEVGSCHFANSACWIEIVNVGSAAEELSYYELRTQSARSTAPYTVTPSRTFDLPTAAIAAGGRLVVRARSEGALADGQGVVHIADGGDLPWWSGDGFVELRTAQRTVDYVRFGDNDVAPSTKSEWSGEAAPILPSGAEGYGYALARNLQSGDTNSAADWTLRAFSTPGGPNDVTSDVDSDVDGIPDSAEVSGGKFAGIDVYAIGARVGKRDLFIEIDRMDSSDPAVIPRREALDKLVATFAKRGFALHFDVGDLFTPNFDPAQYNLGGGNVVPFANEASFGGGAGVADVYEYKAAHMASARRTFFYYMLFAWTQGGSSKGSSGIGERPGNDSIITLGGWGLDVGSTSRKNLLINYQAATIMHEFGHNLGLRHGGSDELNRKPNYVSVMNYLYSPLGLPVIGQAEGDRFDIYAKCSIFSVAYLTNPPSGAPESFVLDYSDGLSGDLSEYSVDESDGLGRNNSKAVDFNCNGKTDSGYARDLNKDDSKDVLTDHDDWSALDIVFRRTFSGNESGPRDWFSRLLETRRDDTQTDDIQRVVSEPCPPPGG